MFELLCHIGISKLLPCPKADGFVDELRACVFDRGHVHAKNVEGPLPAPRVRRARARPRG